MYGTITSLLDLLCSAKHSSPTAISLSCWYHGWWQIGQENETTHPEGIERHAQSMKTPSRSVESNFSSTIPIPGGLEETCENDVRGFTRVSYIVYMMVTLST